ncbi:MAG: hemerythrin domain-containing protein [Chloroflexi bacterium]|nr:hemerythrin domain-containing protein [Chloroflexota bacterium]
MARRQESLIPLSREHHSALVMALRIEREIPDADGAGAREVYDALIAFWARGLLPHFRAEGECLLARLVRHVDVEDELVRRTERDHLTMEALVARMRDTNDLQARRGLLLEFAKTIRAHVRWEEEVLFAETERLLTEAEMTALGAEVAERVGDGNAATVGMKRDRVVPGRDPARCPAPVDGDAHVARVGDRRSHLDLGLDAASEAAKVVEAEETRT